MSIRSFFSQVIPDRFFEKDNVDSADDEAASDRPAGIEVIAWLLLGAATARWLWEYPHMLHRLFRLFH